MSRTMLENVTALELTKMVKSQVRTNQVVFQRGDDLFWKAEGPGGGWEVATCEDM